ncbi:MAG TPA: cytochrome c oxidase assembly protein [Devosiaceae bacterium]|jgi:cytochrome c oxidase assembly protein subunit 11|nr:cytochrome c oxidase assembly protein [Devosiaceae bacterium]
MTETALSASSPNRNNRLAIMLVAIVVGMVGMAYAAVPLYTLFCQVTGFGGTTQVAAGNPKGIIAREMKMSFDASVSGNLPWRVQPAAPVTSEIGTVHTVNYIAENRSSRAVTGTAIFNVTPDAAGIYFNKIECFCFTEQTLQPGERVEMPVTFFVDPDLAGNEELDTIREITLSYTFYASNTEES